ncbi:MAG: beta-glucoside-specific PTS transporter subunit IIABC [Eubacterium sp.]|nr:beta-glucoside-specific PTS transporter subunit IIABC [Eubacterium sp.]
MAMDYVDVSKKIISAVGGADNISSATHCMTRLRLILKDQARADDGKVESIKGVKSVIKQGGQYQIVIGNEVSNLFKEFSKMGKFTDDGGVAPKAEGPIIQRLFGFVAGCLTPMLPAMLGTGMLKVVLTLLTTLNIVSATDATYQIFYSIADGFFYFLPIFLGWSIAKKVNGNAPLYMAVGALLCYPDLVALMGGTLESATEYGEFLGMGCTYLFGVVPVIETTYTSSVVPMLLMAPLMKWAEDFADRISPNVLKAFLKPLLFFLICTPVVMIVLGPIGGVVGNVMAVAFNTLYGKVPWLTVGLLSALMPFIVMTGMHYALIPLFMNNIATLGYDVVVLVTMFCSNICQGGAAFGVAAKTKDVETRSEGIACGISAAVAGVTEPALYGINLRYMKPMIGAVAGAGAAGLLAGIMGVRGYTMGGSPSFLSLITFIGGDSPYHSVIWGAVCGALGLVISFAVSFVLYKDPQKQSAGMADASVGAASAMALSDETVASPVNGEVKPLSEVADDAFSSGALGQGIALVPSEGKVYAPVDGEVTTFFPTGHAIGLLSNGGAEILIHVGMDTVKLDGRGFTPRVSQGSRVKKGDLLLEFDLELIQEEGYSTVTPMIVTNTDDYTAVEPVRARSLHTGDAAIRIQK